MAWPIALWLSVVIVQGPAACTADEPSSQRTTMRLVTYTAPVEKTTTTTSSLRWVPHPSAKVSSDDAVVRASGTSDSAYGELPDAPPVATDSRRRASPDRSTSSDADSELSGLRADRPGPTAVTQQDTVQQWRRAGSPPTFTPKPLPLPSPSPSHATPPSPARVPEPSTLPPLSVIRSAPTLEEQLAARPEVFAEKCPSPRDLKPISKITDDIRPNSRDVPTECSLGETRFRPRCWAPTTFTWTAAATYNKPLYFEQEQLERYGHSCGPYVQPTVSAVHFFATIPLLPYMMAIYPPEEIQYSLGYYRPGNCAPYYLDPFPISVRGAVVEGTFWTGVPFIF